VASGMTQSLFYFSVAWYSRSLGSASTTEAAQGGRRLQCPAGGAEPTASSIDNNKSREVLHLNHLHCKICFYLFNPFNLMVQC
jgi:formate dehydrogenase maturation protein FdhE